MMSISRNMMMGVALAFGLALAGNANAAPLVTVGVHLPVVRVMPVAPPVIVMAPPQVWVPAHYVYDNRGRQIFVAGHYRGDNGVRRVVTAQPRRVVVVRR